MGTTFKGILSLMQARSSACARATLVRPGSAVPADHESMHADDEYEGSFAILADDVQSAGVARAAESRV